MIDYVGKAGHLFDMPPVVGTRDLGLKWKAVTRCLDLFFVTHLETWPANTVTTATGCASQNETTRRIGIEMYPILHNDNDNDIDTCTFFGEISTLV